MPDPTPQKKTRIFIVDDHPLMREGLTHILEQQPDMEVCFQAKDAAEALSEIGGSRPDLVLADIMLPGKSGLELVKEIKALHPRIPALVISMHDETMYAERALRAGANGYITKEAPVEELLQAIRDVLHGSVYTGKKTSAMIESLLSGRASGRERSPIAQLTNREFDVFRLLGDGLSTDETARRLNLSRKTVETHRVKIKRKLELETATELVAYAAKWGATAAEDIRGQQKSKGRP